MPERVFREELIKTLKKTMKNRKNDQKLLKLMHKIEKKKRLKSREFLSVHAMLWKAGPTSQYRNPAKCERVPRNVYYSKT
jgi:hypothetical protein